MSAASITVRKAKEELLKGGPRHYKELAKILFRPPYAIAKRGKDPEYTVYADLFFAVKAADTDLRMIGRGVFALASHGDVSGAEYAPSRTVTATVKPVTEWTDDEILARLTSLKTEHDELHKVWTARKAKDKPATPKPEDKPSTEKTAATK